MKKILSLVLAVAMLSTMAFAANTQLGVSAKPGDEIEISADNFVEFDKDGNSTTMPTPKIGDFNSTNFRIVKASYSKGAALVASTAFNDDDKIVITLKQDYTLVIPKTGKAQNLVIGDLKIQSKSTKLKDKDGNNFPRTTVFEYNGRKEAYVGYSNATKLIDGNLEYVNGDMIKFVAEEKDADGNVMKGDAVGIASYSDCPDLYIEGRVYADDKVYFKADNKANTNVLKMPATEDATLRFVNITTNGLPTNNDVQILAAHDEFVYKIVDDKLAASGLKWSEDDGAWIGKLRTSTSYVISDIELKISASTAGSENPDTGANDVVGVAAALAVVSVVAAAAVSLKK